MAAADEQNRNTEHTRGKTRARRPTGGIVVACAVLLVLGFTLRDYGLTTDEPIYILNTHRVLDWTTDLFRQGPSAVFER